MRMKQNQLNLKFKFNMKVELKQIIDELSDAIGLADDQRVAALVEDEEIIGWTIVNVLDDGTINPVDDNKFKTLKELLAFYY